MYADKPQTVSQALLSSLQIYRKSAVKILILSLLWALIWQGCQIASNIMISIDHAANVYWQLMASILLSLFVLVWLGGGMYNLMHYRAQNQKVTIGRSLWEVKSALVRLVLTFLFFTVVLFGLAEASNGIGYLLWQYTPLPTNMLQLTVITLFCVLAIIFTVYCLLIEPTIVVDDFRFIKAIKQSFCLVKGHFWYTFAIIFWPFFVLLVLFNFVPILFNLAEGMTPIGMLWVQLAVTVVVIMLILPWTVSSILVIRHNLKLFRQEPVSVEEPTADNSSEIKD